MRAELVFAFAGILVFGFCFVDGANASAAEGSPVGVAEELYNAATHTGTGWFQRQRFDFDLADMPTGNVELAGVRWRVRDGRTIMTAGAGCAVGDERVGGIRVERKADTLHFLHTFNPGPAVEQAKVALATEKRKLSKPPVPPTVFRYVVHYADGTSVPIDVRWNEGVGDWLRKGPVPEMLWAKPAWVQKLDEPYGGRLVVYAMAWPNPRPQAEIESVDVVSANNNYRDWGAPAVFAISTSKGLTGRRLYISTQGKDSNPGTFDQPWRTIHKSAGEVQPGDIVYLRGGYYGPTDQIVVSTSGREGRWITFSAYPGETPVLDGYHHLPDPTYEGPPNWSDWGFVQLMGVDYVRVQGLTIQRSRRQGLNMFECGKVDILHNTFYKTAECGMRTYAHWWRGRQLEWSHDIRIYGNTLARVHDKQMHRDMHDGIVPRPTTGHEGITIAWTDGFDIGFNEIYGCGKEAIDCKNANSNGRIHHNYIHDGTATGIYLDGWGQQVQNMEIYENTLHNVGGISISSEQEGAELTNIHVHHNVVWHILTSGISVSSSYGSHYSPQEDIIVEKNTVHRSGYPSSAWGWWGSNINIRGKALSQVLVRDNVATDAYGAQISLDPEAMESGEVEMMNNLSHPFREKRPGQRDNRRGVKGEDAILESPRYVAPQEGDFRLQPGSPARGAATDGGDLGALHEDSGVLHWHALTDVNQDFGDPALATAAGQQPVDIPKRLLNTRAHRLGWQKALFNFGLHYNYDFLPLPVGETVLSGVKWFLPDHNDTSGPTLITLKGFGSQADESAVRDIPVGRRADALFFLHTYNRGPAVRQWESAGDDVSAAPTVFSYVVHYAGGGSIRVPVQYGVHIDQWLRKRPQDGMLGSLPAAHVAWYRQVWHRWGHRGHEEVRIYRMAWENPQPAKTIESLDILSANDEQHDWGSPAVLGITTGVRE